MPIKNIIIAFIYFVSLSSRGSEVCGNLRYDEKRLRQSIEQAFENSDDSSICKEITKRLVVDLSCPENQSLNVDLKRKPKGSSFRFITISEFLETKKPIEVTSHLTSVFETLCKPAIHEETTCNMRISMDMILQQHIPMSTCDIIDLEDPRVSVESRLEYYNSFNESIAHRIDVNFSAFEKFITKRDLRKTYQLSTLCHSVAEEAKEPFFSFFFKKGYKLKKDFVILPHRDIRIKVKGIANEISGNKGHILLNFAKELSEGCKKN